MGVRIKDFLKDSSGKMHGTYKIFQISMCSVSHQCRYSIKQAPNAAASMQVTNYAPKLQAGDPPSQLDIIYFNVYNSPLISLPSRQLSQRGIITPVVSRHWESASGRVLILYDLAHVHYSYHRECGLESLNRLNLRLSVNQETADQINVL